MGPVLTGASFNSGNNSHSIWTKKPGAKWVKSQTLQQKAAASSIFKKSYEQFSVLGA